MVAKAIAAKEGSEKKMLLAAEAEAKLKEERKVLMDKEAVSAAEAQCAREERTRVEAALLKEQAARA